jgi:hypothetical protein
MSPEERDVIMEENNGRRKECFSFQKMALFMLAQIASGRSMVEAERKAQNRGGKPGTHCGRIGIAERKSFINIPLPKGGGQAKDLGEVPCPPILSALFTLGDLESGILMDGVKEQMLPFIIITIYKSQWMSGEYKKI